MAASLLRILAFIGLLGIVLAVPAAAGAPSEPATYLRHQLRAMEKHYVYKRANATSYDIAKAQKLVEAAAAQQGEYNSYRVANPRRNNYYANNLPKPELVTRKSLRRDNEPVPPTLNSTVRAAAALLAENHAAQQAANGSLHKIYSQPANVPGFTNASKKTKRAAASYWVGEIEHTGLAPMGQNSSWLVFRDVTDPMFAGGAKGDGVTDDTAAINAAIAYGGNCGLGCLSSSTKGTLIYFPPGTYLISTPIEAYYYSQLVGDPNDKPVIKTSPSFIGLGAIETDVYETNANGDEWYINQSNFYRQVRNFIIDIQDTTTASVAGLHWQVAQATSLTNVYVYAPLDDDTTAMGMFTENGSSGFMGDCLFTGGAYGIYGGNQQYTVRSFRFLAQTKAAICLIWDWGWTWSDLYIFEVPIGLLLINPEDTTGQQAGSIYVLDSTFDTVDVAIHANTLPATILDSSVITLDNIAVTGVTEMVTFSDGSSLSIPVEATNFLIIGNIELSGASYGKWTVDVASPSPDLTSVRTASLGFYRDTYYLQTRPQYEDIDVADIVNVKEFGAMGDGVTDDTAIISQALSMANEDNLIYFPAGSYIITETLQMDPGTRITGEVWSQLVASGDYFADMENPQPMLRVGAVGDTGLIEISDMLFTSKGALPGLVMVEWNMGSDYQGSVGLWDSHFRVGGADGSELQVAQCPKSEPIQTGCIAASMMLHVTDGASGYFENMWAWVADHDLDDTENTMITVAVARGILVEATGATWFYGTASEHSILYQYNFYGSANTFAGMIQTESPYFQYTTETESPGPFNASIGLFNNDPTFPDSSCSADDLLCNFSWAVMIQSTENLTIAGAGLYSWFDDYNQLVCVDAQNCQQRLVNDQGSNAQLYIWNLVTIGAVEMLSNTESGTVIYAANNTQATAHPFWSILGAYLDDYESSYIFCDDDDYESYSGCNEDYPCDLTLSFDTLDALDAASGSYPLECIEYYTLDTLGTLIATAMDNYTTINEGYDQLWPYYVEYLDDVVPASITSYVAISTSDEPAGGPGNAFFSCYFVEEPTGSDTLHFNPCPAPTNQIGFVDKFTVTYTLEDADGFWDGISSAYGIEQSWVSLTGTTSTKQTCTGAGSDSGGNARLTRRECEEIDHEYIGLPQSSGNITVTNPKDVISQAIPTLGTLQTTILGYQMDVMMGQYVGSTDDIVQVVSMPVLLLIQAVQQMQNAKDEAEKQKKTDNTKFILELLGFIFAFLPVLDDLTPAIEGLDIVLQVAGAIGNTVLTIQDIIAHPEDAPMELLGALTGGISKSEKEMSTLADTRRAISSNDLGKIGSDFESLDAKMQNFLKNACPA